MLVPADAPALQHRPRLTLRLRVALRSTVYELRGPTDQTPHGDLLGLVELRRRGPRGHLEARVGASDEHGPVLFTAAPRRRLDLAPAWDVRDADGALLGFFRADLAASLLRATYQVEGAGWVGRGRAAGAGSRGLVSVRPRAADVAVTTPEGAPLLRLERHLDPARRCTVDVPDPRVDLRVAAAFAVGLDTVLAR